MRAVEDVCVFYKMQCTYKPILTGKPIENIRPKTKRTKTSECYGTHKLDAHRCPPDKSMPKNIIKFNNEQGTIHPTQKPVALMEYLIKTYTNPSETVLDFTMGSGTTGVAALRNGRKFIGIELDPTYYGIACDRVLSEAAN